MAKILISGGTGLIGKELSKRLYEKGHEIAIIGRTNQIQIPYQIYSWNEIEKIENVDYIIHLAGANIGEKRWTVKRKKQILDSRIETSNLLFEKIPPKSKNLKAIISASAIGFYGAINSDKIFTEEDAAANDFLGETCKKWEESVDKFQKLGIRIVKIRTGVVLTKTGGALAKMIVPFKFGFGSALGNGKQFMPWIHIEDLCDIYTKAIEEKQIQGIFNAVAPEFTTNYNFTKTLAKLMNKAFWFPNVPSFVLKLMFGKMAEILLKGSRVSPQKIIDSGFTFKFPNLEKALADLTNKD